MTRTLLALGALLATAVPAFATGTGLDYAPPAAPPPPDLGGLVLRLVLLTGALIGLCVAVLWFARRANRPAGGTGDGGGRLTLDASLPLDRACAVHLISVDGQAVAVTTDATGLRSLVLLSERFEDALNEDGRPEPAAPSEPEGVAPAVTAPPADKPKWSADDVRQLLQRLVRRADGPGVHLEPALRDDQP